MDTNTPRTNTFLKLVPETSAPVGAPAAPKKMETAALPPPATTEEDAATSSSVPLANDYPTHTHLKPTLLPTPVYAAAPKIPASLAMAGFARINVQATMSGHHDCGDKDMALKCLVGAWASFMNCGRKGDAEKMRKMGEAIFGEEEFEEQVEEMCGGGEE